jgi:hypothetical protein
LRAESRVAGGALPSRGGGERVADWVSLGCGAQAADAGGGDPFRKGRGMDGAPGSRRLRAMRVVLSQVPKCEGPGASSQLPLMLAVRLLWFPQPFRKGRGMVGALLMGGGVGWWLRSLTGGRRRRPGWFGR